MAFTTCNRCFCKCMILNNAHHPSLQHSPKGTAQKHTLQPGPSMLPPRAAQQPDADPGMGQQVLDAFYLHSVHPPGPRTHRPCPWAGGQKPPSWKAQEVSWPTMSVFQMKRFPSALWSAIAFTHVLVHRASVFCTPACRESRRCEVSAAVDTVRTRPTCRSFQRLGVGDKKSNNCTIRGKIATEKMSEQVAKC